MPIDRALFGAVDNFGAVRRSLNVILRANRKRGESLAFPGFVGQGYPPPRETTTWLVLAGSTALFGGSRISRAATTQGS